MLFDNGVCLNSRLRDVRPYVLAWKLGMGLSLSQNKVDLIRRLLINGRDLLSSTKFVSFANQPIWFGCAPIFIIFIKKEVVFSGIFFLDYSIIVNFPSLKT